MLQIREREFVLAAQAMGMRSLRILVRTILPNTIGPAIPTAEFGPNLPTIRGPYIYIRERLGRAALPVALRMGPATTVGRCRAWTGEYRATGDAWLATQRRQVSILVIGHGWSHRHSLDYVASTMCR